MKVRVKYENSNFKDEEIEINNLKDIDTNYERNFVITSNRQDEEGYCETLVIDKGSVKSIIITEF